MHQLRNLTTFVSYKDLMTQLKGIYGVADAQQARNRLEDFAESPLGKRYSVIKGMWLNHWEQIIP